MRDLAYGSPTGVRAKIPPPARLGLRVADRRASENSPPGSSFLLKPVFYWLFSVAGASFGLETFEPGGPNVSLDLAREPLNPRLFVPAP